jgi:hypothetical protein
LALPFCAGLAALVAPAIDVERPASWQYSVAMAEPSGTPEKEAFEAAKELGTKDAWNAFLANYSTGFHADLARAYLKKLADLPQAAALPPDDFPTVAGSWGGIVRDGPGQSYRNIDSLEEGQQVTLMARTEVIENGFPWFKIAYEGDGKGYQWGGILCSTGAERPDLFKTCPTAPPPAKHETDTTTRRQSESREAPKGCASGYVPIDGKCIKQRDASTYCGPGYRLQGNKCVQGYQAPKPQKQLPSWQSNAIKKGCPKGMDWNAAEGCHEND